MPVGNELRNIRLNRSGDGAIKISARSGDSEDGDSIFDMMSSGEPSAYDVVVEEDESRERKRFLKQYFTLLKNVLNRFEFEYIKLLYMEGVDDLTACNMLALNRKLLKQNMLGKLSAHQEEIEELVEASEWSDAELFAKYFLASPAEIKVQGDNAEEARPKTIRGFGNLVKAWGIKYYRKIYRHEWYKRREPSRECILINRFTREIKEAVRSVASLLKVLSPDFLKGYAEAVKEAVKGESALPVLSKFYCATYEIICGCVQDLCGYVFGTKEEPQEEQEGEVLCQT